MPYAFLFRDLNPLKIVVADDLPASALDVLRTEGWEIDARTGRGPKVRPASGRTG